MIDDLFLIDTSAWVCALRPDGPAAIRVRIAEILGARKGVTTPPILLELLAGARDEKSYTELSEEISGLEQFPINEILWEKSYRFAFDLRKRGLTIPAIDVLIATVAQENELILVHADRHFDLMAGKTSLRVESWVREVSPRSRKTP
jgi:predicted nucleic acid-binding protein